ncbi:hypothetical protein ACHAXR_010059 [Thalassiosira sp. AJA248-18]
MMNAKPSSDSKAAVLLLFFFKAIVTHAFVTPSQQIQYRASTSLKALPEVNPFLLSDGLSAATSFSARSYNMGGSEALSPLSESLSTLRTFFIVVTAAIFGVTAIVYLTAAFLVPKAAEQLERDTKRLRPGLWEEYESKMETGETMVNRPDLLQELGNTMQPIIAEEYEKEYEKKVKGGAEASGSAGASSGKDQGGVIDVPVKEPKD